VYWRTTPNERDHAIRWIEDKRGKGYRCANHPASQPTSQPTNERRVFAELNQLAAESRLMISRDTLPRYKARFKVEG